MEALVLDGLALNDTTFALESFDAPPPNQRAEWVGSADSEFQTLSRDPLYENRTITTRLWVQPQASKNLALDKVGLIRDKLAEASKNAGGLPLVWTPHNSTRSVTFDVLAGSVSDLPIDVMFVDGNAPAVTLVMTAKPFWRGAEALSSSTASGTAPITTMTLASVAGDAPALGRLIVTNNSGAAVRFMEWGLEQRGYSSGNGLVIDSDALVTSGFAGTGTTRTGAYDPGSSGNSVVRATLVGSAQAVCGTGTLAHVGRFRVRARMHIGSSVVRVRLVWRAGDGTYTANAWTAPPAIGWCSPDLGSIYLPAAVTGTQAWDARIEGYTTDGSSQAVDVDFVDLMPAEHGYGRARAVATNAASGVVSARDEFTGTTAGGTLNGRVPPAGAAWATTGAATDFTFADDGTSEYVVRATNDASFRLGALGSAMTNTLVQSLVASSIAQADLLGVVARYVDGSNYLRFDVQANTGTIRLAKVVAGTETVLASGTTSAVGSYWLDLLVYDTGLIIGRATPTAGSGSVTIAAVDSVAATAGTLASGRPGLADRGGGTLPRAYDYITATIPPAEQIVAYASRKIEVRHDDTIRENSSGGTWGRPSSYRGSRFVIEPAGTDALTSRVAVRLNANDLDAATYDTLVPSHSIQVGITPRGLVVPR